MSTELLVILTVVEIAALVLVLALFIVSITNRLNSIARSLGQVSGDTIRSIQGDVCLIGAGAAILNRKLDTIAGALPAIAAKAEALPTAAPKVESSFAQQAYANQNAQDPMIRRG